MQKRMSVVERSWVLYDVANSAFVLVVVTALMPIYFKDVIAAGMTASNSTAWWGYANSAASLLLAILAPLLGALADYPSRKKKLFLAFLILGLVFTCLLSWPGRGQWVLCLIFFILARIGWAGANLFYDAFLVDVTDKSRMDMISARGYAYGYVGSVVPFSVIIGLILAAGMADGLPPGPTRIGFFVVAGWWLLFSLPAIRHLRQQHALVAGHGGVEESVLRLAKTVRDIAHHRRIFLFLAAYFFYIDGVGTIISMSTAYGRDLGFGVTMLIVVLLFIQLVAYPCSLLYGSLAVRFSTKTMLLGGIGVYSIATLCAFFLPAIKAQSLKIAMFWLIAFLVSSAMGGIQALSRSYYGQLIPPERSGEFYGFYNIFGKFAAICGPALMGVVSQLTGDSRWGVLSIVVLFVAGGLLLLRVEADQAA
jgi:UMF1 family MFS transporter